MKRFLIFAFIIVFLEACPFKTDPATPYKISNGADSLLKSYNLFFENNVCTLAVVAGDTGFCVPMTMPVNCYTNHAHSDSLISFCTIYQNKKLRTFWDLPSNWGFLGNCKPSQIFFPLDSTHPAIVTNDNFNIRFVDTSIYWNFISTINTNYRRSLDTLLKHGMPIIPFEKIARIDNFKLEDTLKSTYLKMPAYYINTFSSAGILVDVYLKDSTKQTCYIISNYDENTLKWKVNF